MMIVATDIKTNYLLKPLPCSLPGKGKCISIRSQQVRNMKTFRGRFDARTMAEKLPLPGGLITSIDDVKGLAKIRRSNTYMTWECFVSEQREPNGHKTFSFNHGWPQLVAANSVEDGDLLYFEFHGNSVFTMTVVGPDNISKEVQEVIVDVERSHYCTISGMQLLITPSENSMAAATYMVNSDKERFMVSCSGETVDEGYLIIPTGFAKKHLIYENVDDNVPVVLELGGNKATVAMRYLRNEDGDLHGCILNSSFQSFAKYHGLDQGGVVVFELESPFDPVVFKLSLFNK